MILYNIVEKAPRRPVAPFLGLGSILILGVTKRTVYAIHRGMVGYNIHIKWPLFRTLFIGIWESVDIARDTRQGKEWIYNVVYKIGECDIDNDIRE